jgi:hypothetical protein
MRVDFTKKFMKCLRLSLGLNERQIAEQIGITLEHYLAFEDTPAAFGGEVIARYIRFLQSIPEVENLDMMFMEFAKFDLKTRSGAVDIFARYPLRLVDSEETILYAGI